MKNCDRGLENAARGRRPRAAFSSPRSQFLTIRTDPKPANNLFIYFLLQIGLQVGLRIGRAYVGCSENAECGV